MNEDLQSKLDMVCDEDTFISFLTALAADRADEVRKEKMTPSSPYSAGTNGWENGSIESFLESAAAFGIAWKKNPTGLPATDNPWKRCARIIYAGKYYE